MKTLKDYIEEPIGDLFEKYDCFVAKSEDEYLDRRSEDPSVKYMILHMHVFCPAQHAMEVMSEIDRIHESARMIDLAEHGQENIIRRELGLCKVFEGGDIRAVMAFLSHYQIDQQEIMKVYNQEVIERNLNHGKQFN